MRKVIILGLIFLTIGSISCTKDNDETPITISSTTSNLEGVWRLQNLQTAIKLTFTGQNFRMESGTVVIKGTFLINGSSLQGTVTSREGVTSNLIQPNMFIGDFKITDNKVTFTNFTGDWIVPFSSWYQRQ